MIVWRCSISHPERGTLLSWHDSRSEANRALVAWFDSADFDDVGPNTVTHVEIPTKKADLLAWLNSNVTTDHG